MILTAAEMRNPVVVCDLGNKILDRFYRIYDVLEFPGLPPEQEEVFEMARNYTITMMVQAGTVQPEVIEWCLRCIVRCVKAAKAFLFGAAGVEEVLVLLDEVEALATY